MMTAVGALSAAPITGLFNTGASVTGTTDNYWRIITPDGPAEVILQSIYPLTWVPASSDSGWVWRDNQGQPTGTGANPLVYVFRYTFALAPTLDPGSVLITGQWSTDNAGNDILVNGVSTGLSSPGYTSFTGFTLNSDFRAGNNTIDFVVTDWGNIGGFRLEWLSATANLLAPEPSSSVPEPSSLILVALGVAGVALGRMRSA